jgi:hypothetical protein
VTTSGPLEQARLGQTMTPDNAQPEDLEEEPPGFWAPIHEQVQAWIDEYGDDSPDSAD